MNAESRTARKGMTTVPIPTRAVIIALDVWFVIMPVVYVVLYIMVYTDRLAGFRSALLNDPIPSGEFATFLLIYGFLALVITSVGAFLCDADRRFAKRKWLQAISYVILIALPPFSAPLWYINWFRPEMRAREGFVLLLPFSRGRLGVLLSIYVIILIVATCRGGEWLAVLFGPPIFAIVGAFLDGRLARGGEAMNRKSVSNAVALGVGCGALVAIGATIVATVMRWHTSNWQTAILSVFAAGVCGMGQGCFFGAFICFIRGRKKFGGTSSCDRPWWNLGDD